VEGAHDEVLRLEHAMHLQGIKPHNTATDFTFQVAKLFADSSTIAITSFISPYKADRQSARDLHAVTTGDDEPLPFIEVFVDIPLEVAEARDPKGLYKKAREGKIPEFTGISAPYEAPEKAEIHIRSDLKSVEDSVKEITEYLQAKGLLSKE
jgi:adenylylsulfate kinase